MSAADEWRNDRFSAPPQDSEWICIVAMALEARSRHMLGTGRGMSSLSLINSRRTWYTYTHRLLARYKAQRTCRRGPGSAKWTGPIQVRAVSSMRLSAKWSYFRCLSVAEGPFLLLSRMSEMHLNRPFRLPPPPQTSLVLVWRIAELRARRAPRTCLHSAGARQAAVGDERGSTAG